MDYIRAGIIAGLTFVALDAVWLGFIARSLYKEQIGALMRPQPHWLSAACVYVLMIAGFVWFVYPQVMMVRSVVNAVQYGARFGVILFGLYEFTNYATLAGWSSSLVLIDTIWGGVLYAAASAAVFYLRNIW
jgi:uncharacterized membrane protein